MRKLIAEASGVVEAPPARVWQALLPEGRREKGRFTVEDFPGHTSTVEITDDLIAYQGGWWYRGEWSVEPHPQGTRVIHRVFNVAARGRWAVPLANRLFIGSQAAVEKACDEKITHLKRLLS